MKRVEKPLVLLELNEVNFDYVRRYVDRGYLPSFKRLLETHGLAETVSEQEYAHLEPWIQWVTAHTGLSYGEHGVFRLGDIVNFDLPQIWEVLEATGLSVGAISPINAANRTQHSPFFLPDPWTKTRVSGGWVLRGLHAALRQAVGENAQRRLTLATLLRVLGGVAWHFRTSSFTQLLEYARQRRHKPWNSSLLLDRLLADVFLVQWRRTRPDFASLFLNAAAHVQHHYMFSSQVYDGPQRNPEWYVRSAADPLLEVYALYDRIVADVLAMPDAPRIIIATGLHQEPYSEELYYYRLKNHAHFLEQLKLPFSSVEARMSRDFTVYCSSQPNARECEAVLRRLNAPDGTPLFTVDNRGSDLFVMLTYPREIRGGFIFTLDSRPQWDLSTDVAFVALKNGEHDGTGYLVDTGAPPVTAGTRVPLSEIFGRVCAALGVSPAISGRGVARPLRAA